MGRLSVYSASAGSGKTHRIVGEYILMLFFNENAYKHILAVTFTNKAGEEMKKRIIHELDNLAAGKKSDYIPNLTKKLGLNEKKVRQIAKRKFREILHDYSHFSISTIDSFFQKILKNFTYETGIQYNYEIELDSDSVINQVVDGLIVLSHEDRQLKEHLVKLINQNIAEGKKWDVRYSLKDFISNVYHSDYRVYENKYTDFFKNVEKQKQFKKELNKILINFEADIEKCNDEIKSVMNANGVGIEHFKGGKSRSIIKRILGFKDKLTDSSVEEVFKNFDDVSEWLKKNELDDISKTAVVEKIIHSCATYKSFLSRCLPEYITATLIKFQFHYISLINYGLKGLAEYKEENDKFLIAEVPSFLSEISNQNSAPFIYEKIGTYYNNYLIDEFQDTSRVQWDAFRPLILESLAHHSEFHNILVGDVKQSIYAWRGGDWELLADKVNKDFPDYFKRIPLEDNWRSGKNIVEFNNLFFEKASIELQNIFNNSIKNDLNSDLSEKIQSSVYNNIKQNIKKDNDSFIEISLIDKKISKENRQVSMDIMIEQIERVQQKNHKAGDIMILVRSNSEGKEVADYIIEYSQSDSAKPDINYDVISADSLFVAGNDAVCFLISCLKYFLNPDDKLAYTEAAYIFYRINYLKSASKIDFDLMKYYQDFNDKINDTENLNLSTSLPEFTDKIISVFGLNHSKNVPYLTSFRDIVHEYSQKYSADIYGFIEWWEDSGKDRTIKIPENQNAINIITTHKAKGLAADFVFIPFCNWSFEKSGNITWCKIPEKPFDVLPAWPLNYNKTLGLSSAAINYENQRFNKILESFNLLYVAFTRAKKALFVNSLCKEGKNVNNVGQLVSLITQNSSLLNELGFSSLESNDNEIKRFAKGHIELAKHQETESNYFESYPVYLPSKLPVIKPFHNLKKEKSDSIDMVQKGIIYHQLFERIQKVSDLKYAINELVSKGLVREQEYDFIFNSMKGLLENQLVAEWYNDKYDVLNEAEIFCGDGEIRRPDRIMIKDNNVVVVDYKFGNIQKQLYEKQIHEYGKLLEDMGFDNVEMYLWYVFLNKLVKVDMQNNSKEIMIEA